MTITKQMPNESAKAYHAFKTYCEMGPEERTQEAVAKKLAKSRQFISRWSSRHKWKTRASLWDNERAEVEQDAAERAARELAKELARRREKVQESAWEVFEKLKAKATEMLAFPVDRVERVVEIHPDGKEKTVNVYTPMRWNFGDLARCLQLADQLGRLSTGLATEKHELTGPNDKPFIIPSAAQPRPIVIHVTHDDDTARARALFGERPATKPS